MKKFFMICAIVLLFAGCSGNNSVKTITADLLAGALSTAISTSFDCAATTLSNLACSTITI